MDEKTLKICQTVCEDRNLLRKQMVWEAGCDSLANLSAFLYAGEGKRADASKYKECLALLKKKVSGFSEIRGIIRAIIVTKMCLSDDPEVFIDGVQETYKKLRSLHPLTASPHMVLAAVIIFEYAGSAEADKYIERLEKLYSLTKSDHPFLTNDEDRPLLASVIASDRSEEELAEKIEANYQVFKEMSMHHNSLQSMAEALALSAKDPQLLRSEVEVLEKGLRDAGKRIDKEYGYAVLGLMTTLDIPTDQILTQLIEVDDYLKTQKGFKWYNGDGSKMRRLYDCLVVMLANTDKTNQFFSAATASTITFIIDAIVASMIATQAAVTAAATSSH